MVHLGPLNGAHRVLFNHQGLECRGHQKPAGPFAVRGPGAQGAHGEIPGKLQWRYDMNEDTET